MNISARTQSLIDLLPKDHRLTPSMRSAMIDALAASEGFAGHRIALASDPRRTDLDRRLTLKESLTKNHGRVLARAETPIARARAEITARRDALVVKPGPSNSAGAIGHMENRTWLRSLDIGARQGIALSTNDPEILHSLLLKPDLSGLVSLPVPIIDQIRQRYMGMVYPVELDAIAADDAAVVPAEQACHMARSEMAGTADLHLHEFSELMKTIELGRVWLLKGRKQVCEVDSAGKAAYRLATEDEAANGIEYENYAAYLTAQAA